MKASEMKDVIKDELPLCEFQHAKESCSPDNVTFSLLDLIKIFSTSLQEWEQERQAHTILKGKYDEMVEVVRQKDEQIKVSFCIKP